MARPTDLEDTTAGFVDNLWKIVNNDEYKEYISWNKDGTGVLINRSQKTYIENAILPRLGCKTRNFNSFIRNLNKYDFHRNKNPDEYTNPNFRKDEPELRKKIKLNKGPEKQRQQQHQQTSNSSLTVMQLAPTVNDIANSPAVAVPSNHPAAFPATSSTSGALLQHSAVLQNVNSPQPSQLFHPQLAATRQSATQQETFQFQVQPRSSHLPTQQGQHYPLINPQLIGNNPLLQEPYGQGACGQQDQLWVPDSWGAPSIDIVGAGQAKLSATPSDIQEWIQSMDCDMPLDFNQQGPQEDFWNAPVTSDFADQGHCESYQLNQTSATSNNNSSGISYGTSSSEENPCQDQELDLRTAVLEAEVTIEPDRAPLEGGGDFHLQFTKELYNFVKSASATFAKHESGVATVWMTCEGESKGFSVMHGKKIPPGDAVGVVIVPIKTKFKGQIMELGQVTFTYFNKEDEKLKELVENDRLQGKYFRLLARQFETREKTSSNSDSSGSPTQEKQHQTSVDILWKLVNTAASIGAEEFIQMVFSTSAGRVIFEAYKTESPLPEDIADSNGHAKVAEYLKGITERFSKEHGSCQTHSQTINWLELARAVEEREAHFGPSATDIIKPLETGTETETETEYFGDTENENPSFGMLEVEYDGDAENSASDSDNGKCDSVDEFKSVICKDSESKEEENQEIEASVEPKLNDDEGEPATRKTLLELARLSIEDGQSGLDRNHPMSESDIHNYRLPDDIGSNWKDLARVLSYNQATIDAIENETVNSNKECCRELLVQWLRREGRDATAGKLADALTSVGLNNLADDLTKGPSHCQSGCRQKVMMEAKCRVESNDPYIVVDNNQFSVTELEDKHSRAMQKCHDIEEKVTYGPSFWSLHDTIEEMKGKEIKELEDSLIRKHEVVDNTAFSDTELEDKHSRAMETCHDTEEKLAYCATPRNLEDRLEELEQKEIIDSIIRDQKKLIEKLQEIRDSVLSQQEKVVDNSELSDTELEGKHLRAKQKCHDTKEKVAFLQDDRILPGTVEALELERRRPFASGVVELLFRFSSYSEVLELLNLPLLKEFKELKDSKTQEQRGWLPSASEVVQFLRSILQRESKELKDSKDTGTGESDLGGQNTNGSDEFEFDGHI